MKKQNMLGIILSLAVGIFCLAALTLKTFFPRIILPNLDGISVVILSLAALVIDWYVSKEHKRNCALLIVYSAIIFGAFPLLSGLCYPIEAVKYALLGAALFTAVTFLFDSIVDRLSTGPASRLAPIFGAFGMYLAFQCLMGIV